MTKLNFQVVDHGINGSQYFPGCGVAFTDYDYCQTGCGDTFAEAIDDALESMAQCEECGDVDFDALAREIAEDGYGTIQDDGTVQWPSTVSAAREWPDADDAYYYVTVRYSRLAPEEINQV